MVRISMRLCSKAASSSAAAAAEFLQRTSKAGSFVQEQFLDPNQLQKLSLTLGRPTLYKSLRIDSKPPPQGTPLPPGYHLAYFTPSGCEQELGLDGTDRTVNPPHPFTRRMWAGGSLHWVRDNLLKVGQTVRETTEVMSAIPKTTREGEEMIVVGVKKTFENDAGIALVDTRNWLFRKEITNPQPPSEKQKSIQLPKGTITRDHCQSPVSLFRFSALTFNAHKIHYSREWCRDVEGHRDIVVHGPLNLINMLDLWRDNQEAGDHVIPQSIDYRATSPLYAGDRYRAVMEKGENGHADNLSIYTPSGAVAMRGKITTL
ncbi:hypothetical protein V499_07825 [Pseudogymnoascus sp. VKM F-103]|nr:hypothetical protein V499_07825 [Pseudogymnoascus sp. VKM F-103]